MLFTRNNDIHSLFTQSSDLLRIPEGTLNFANISARIWNAIVTKINTYRVVFLIN